MILINKQEVISIVLKLVLVLVLIFWPEDYRLDPYPFCQNGHSIDQDTLLLLESVAYFHGIFNDFYAFSLCYNWN